MFARSQQNKVTYSDDSSDPNYVYYDATIISNDFDDVDDSGVVTFDPQITFNDQRTFPIIKDASMYEMSIIRFTLNGPGLDLPLFIPSIQINQPNVNLTEYSVTLSYTQQWSVPTSGGNVLKTFTIAPPPSYVIYVPEVQNPLLAPPPRTTLPAPGTQYGVQDLSSKYYWITTYDYWLSLVNNTFATAQEAVRIAFQTAWNATPSVTPGTFPYPTLASFQLACQTPYMTYDPTTLLFSIYGDTNGFGQRLTSFTPATPGAQAPPQFRIFFNTNMNGLFSNFVTRYWNVVNIPSSVYNNVTYGALTVPSVGGIYDGYVYEVMFTNSFYQNVADFRQAPYTPASPPAPFIPSAYSTVFWVNTQNYKSTDSLWSPIGSIVFTSSLLPIKTEDTSQPNVLGASNTGISNPSGFSAFTPIITDIVIDTSEKGAHAWREFTEYIPQAEYRMISFGSSHQPISNIDISVFWKNRLNNQLYPIYLYNLATVSIKIMFRKKGSYRLKGDN